MIRSVLHPSSLSLTLHRIFSTSPGLVYRPSPHRSLASLLALPSALSLPSPLFSPSPLLSPLSSLSIYLPIYRISHSVVSITHTIYCITGYLPPHRLGVLVTTPGLVSRGVCVGLVHVWIPHHRPFIISMLHLAYLQPIEETGIQQIIS